MSAPKVIHGSLDIIEQLEVALIEAREGRLQGVIIAGIIDGGQGWTGAFRKGIEYPFARLTSAVSSALHDLTTDGIEEWR